jgi:hypothetical protein
MIKAESWVLMALQQCKAIVHFVAPPELLTVGHNPYSNPSVVDAHISIPSMRPKFMSELLSGDMLLHSISTRDMDGPHTVRRAPS